ncbi:hypothetical protein F3Y22_tig00116939pilonHSYRG00059 [Hibiscus syriacus]|uniref:Uncharacterized protein n=1 Tax=Hibiscus syriacus TaxID=106335 RepID=A0A6A2WMG6_HIBSY|nr:hypothetical protein F3Y22_tig00116939pilonHSYRG00059 [Hibiscus syriacus]
MSVIDILEKVDVICKRYEKYDVEKQRDQNVSGDDAFARAYAAVKLTLNPLLSGACFQGEE